MVQVLAVGETIVGAQSSASSTGSSPPPPPARTVTLALTPDQVSTLSLAKSTGALTLSLRNPVDGEQTATAAAATSRPPDPLPVAAPAPARKTPSSRAKRPSHAIQLVVGERRETIYSGGDAR